MDKTGLRKEIRERAALLEPSYMENASRAITEAVKRTEAYKQASCVFIFIGTGAEPDTAGLIKAALDAGKRVFVPRCLKKPVMEAVEVTAATEYEPGAFGIPEPIGEACDKSLLDIAIIPCVTVTKDGWRLGHGAGFYDHFLKDTNIFKLCICFEKLVSRSVPVSSHDIRMDAVITEA